MQIITSTVKIFFELLYWSIFIRVIISWLPIDRNNVFVRIIYTLTEPILSPIRNMIKKSPFGGPGMMLDFSPIIALLFITIIKNMIISFLVSIYI